jgi:hypothetical protein
MTLIGDTLNISSSVKIGNNTLANTLKTTVKQEYAYSDSNTQTPEKWSDNLDSINTNLYLWIRTTTSNSVSESSSVLYEKSYNPNGKE